MAYIARDTDGKIHRCLGLGITRVYFNTQGKVVLRSYGSEDRVKCASRVPFKDQRNPDWLPKDTGVLPAQNSVGVVLRSERNVTV